MYVKYCFGLATGRRIFYCLLNLSHLILQMRYADSSLAFNRRITYIEWSKGSQPAIPPLAMLHPGIKSSSEILDSGRKALDPSQVSR